MATLTKQVGSVDISLDRPTELAFSELTTWVIWQFPRQVDKGLSGAVCPPSPDQGWFPAVIRLKEKVVHVHGHLDEKFESPNDAADWVAETLKNS